MNTMIDDWWLMTIWCHNNKVPHGGRQAHVMRAHSVTMPNANPVQSCNSGFTHASINYFILCTRLLQWPLNSRLVNKLTNTDNSWYVKCTVYHTKKFTLHVQTLFKLQYDTLSWHILNKLLVLVSLHWYNYICTSSILGLMCTKEMCILDNVHNRTTDRLC